MILIDGDYPMAHNALKYERDLTKDLSIYKPQNFF